MKIRSLTFEGSFTDVRQAPAGALPQVAFAGRSNVGKSSLINCLLRRTRSKIAKVSGQPGKTQTLNYFRVNDAFHLVDLPGYGYARVSKTKRAEWQRMVERYLESEQAPEAVVHLIDARHPPTDADLELVDYLAELAIPTLLVLTKVDKLSSTRRERMIKQAGTELGVDDEQLLPFSSVTGEGREDLLAAIEAVLELEEPDGTS